MTPHRCPFLFAVHAVARVVMADTTGGGGTCGGFTASLKCSLLWVSHNTNESYIHTRHTRDHDTHTREKPREMLIHDC